MSFTFSFNSELSRLVAVELADNNRAELFCRGPEGAVSSRFVEFHPWFLADDPNILSGLEGIVDVEKLAGQSRYCYLVSFSGVSAFESALKALKADNAMIHISGPVRDYQQQIFNFLNARLFREMEFRDIVRLQLDIETKTSADEHFPDARRPEDEVTLVSLKDSTGWEICLSSSGQGEPGLLKQLVSVIAERDPDVIEGHNIFNFDLPYLAQRYKRHKIKFAIGRHGCVPSFRSSQFTAGDRVSSFQRCDLYGRHIIDTYQLVQLYDASHRDMDGHGLKYSAKYFGVNSPDRTYVEGSEISRMFAENEALLQAYCLDDARETDALSRILSPSYFYQAQLVPLSYQNCVLRGTGTRVDALLRAEYFARKISVPSPEMTPEGGFQGGLTESLVSGVFANVWHIDVRSLYPSIILADKLSPASDTAGLFGGILGCLREFRLQAKDAARRSSGDEREHFEALQSSFKILINSFYGYAGFAQGTFNDYGMAALVATRGREILTSMRERLAELGAKVIEMDTDGIYFQPPEGAESDEIREKVQQILPEGIVIELDAKYKSMFSYRSKNYALLQENGRVSLSGAALKSRGVEKFLRDYIREYVTRLLEGKQDKIEELHESFRTAIQEHSLPFSDLAKRETLSVSPDGYAQKLAEGKTKRSAAYELARQAPVPYRQGDTVQFYVTGTKKSVSVVENSRLLEMADENVRDENVAYYLDKLEQVHEKFQDALKGI